MHSLIGTFRVYNHKVWFVINQVNDELIMEHPGNGENVRVAVNDTQDAGIAKWRETSAGVGQTVTVPKNMIAYGSHRASGKNGIKSY